MPAYPKHKAVILKGKAYTDFKRDIWENRAKKRCEVCGRCIPLTIDGVFNVFACAHLAHIKRRRVGGDVPENVLIKCYKCHINDEHGPRWSKAEGIT